MLSNEELVKLIKEGQDPDGKYMMDLWKQNKGLIWRTVKPYTNYESEEDLMQEAFIGLSKAVGLFDPNMGASFITYALFWVKQFVVRYIQNNGNLIRIPASHYDLMLKKKKFVADFRSKFGRDPSDQDIAAALKVSLDQLKIIGKTSSSCSNIKSLSDPIKKTDGLDLEDYLSDGSIPQEEVEERLYSEQRAAAVWNEVDQLPAEQKTVIRKRYLEEMSIGQCAEAMHISIDIAKQQNAKAMRALRSEKHSRVLAKYIDSELYNEALHGTLTGFRRTSTSSTERVAIRNVEKHRTALNRIAAFIQ